MTIPAIGSLASLQGAHSEALAQSAPAAETAATGGAEPGVSSSQAPAEVSGEGSFAGALGQALGALESSLAAGETAAAQVATGSTSNPEAAVVKVTDAELEMQLANQIRSKASEAVQTIFQTQV